MTSTETVKNLLTELIDMIDNGSQRDLDRADEISNSIIKLFEQEPAESSGLMTVDEFVERKVNRTLDKIRTEIDLETRFQVMHYTNTDAVIDTVLDVINGYKTKRESKERDKSGHWTPISEGLPKETGWYLITFKTYDGDYAVCEMCYRKPENYWTDKDISKKVFNNSEVEAWTPKPYPYRPYKRRK